MAHDYEELRRRVLEERLRLQQQGRDLDGADVVDLVHTWLEEEDEDERQG